MHPNVPFPSKNGKCSEKEYNPFLDTPLVGCPTFQNVDAPVEQRTVGIVATESRWLKANYTREPELSTTTIKTSDYRCRFSDGQNKSFFKRSAAVL